MKTEINNNDKLLNEEQSQRGAVMRSCIHCGNKKDFEIWTDFEYNDGSGEPTTDNYLVNVDTVHCLRCGEVF